MKLLRDIIKLANEVLEYQYWRLVSLVVLLLPIVLILKLKYLLAILQLIRNQN
jgi:hypothetical protein